MVIGWEDRGIKPRGRRCSRRILVTPLLRMIVVDGGIATIDSGHSQDSLSCFDSFVATLTDLICR